MQFASIGSKINILIVSELQIYPFETGASIAQFGIIEFISRSCNVSVLLPDRLPLADNEFSQLQELLPAVKFYALKDQNNLNNGFIKLSLRKVYRFVRSLLYSRRNSANGSVPVEAIDGYFLANHYYLQNKSKIEKIHEIVINDNINLIQLEGAESVNLVAALPSHIKKVFILHENKLVRLETYLNLRGIQSAFAQYVYCFNKSIELCFLRQFDAVVTFSALDASNLKKNLEHDSKKTDIWVSPYPILDTQFIEIKRDGFLKIDKLIFLGGDSHFPNVDAVEWFLDVAATEIFNSFGLTLHVIGKWEKSTTDKYKAHPSNVKFLGFVKDLHKICKNSISIAPIKIGGGLRTKIMLSMAQGIPVICHRHAATGLNANHLEHLIIADDKNSYVRGIEYILSDLGRTYLMCKNAQKLIKENFSQAVTGDKRLSLYKEILRKNN